MAEKTRSVLDLHVLDCLADDIENVEEVVRKLAASVNDHSAISPEPNREEVITSLSRLIRDNLVRSYAFAEGESSVSALPERALPGGSYDDAYFGITDRGRIVHATWVEE